MRPFGRKPDPAPPGCGGPWLPPADAAELPDDLAALGARLEAAAARRLERRCALRRSLLNAVCVVGVGVPLALSAAAVDLAPASAPVAEVARSQVAWVPSTHTLAAHDRTSSVAMQRSCGPRSDCRAPGFPSAAPSPLRMFN